MIPHCGLSNHFNTQNVQEGVPNYNLVLLRQDKTFVIKGFRIFDLLTIYILNRITKQKLKRFTNQNAFSNLLVLNFKVQSHIKASKMTRTPYKDK